MAKMTIRTLKNGKTRTTVRYKSGNTTYSTTYGGGKRQTYTQRTRCGNTTYSRTR